MKKGYRHGDICFIKISKKPTKLKKSNTNVILQTGSGGNPHSFTGGTFYPVQNEEFVIGYLQAKNTKLFHDEHSPKGAEIENGLYEIHRQQEFTHQGMMAVID